MPSLDRASFDLIVIGAGMAGLTAAGRAASKGLRVIVVEKAPEIGGSAILSGGFVWTLPTSRKLAYVDSGERALGAVVTDTYPALLSWIRSLGVDMAPPQPVLYGRGYQIDMPGYFGRCVAAVEAAGGHVVTGTETLRLLTDGAGRVTGAHTRHADGEVEVEASFTLLATGGVQGSPELRAELIHPNARDMPLRANAQSVGDGLRLGIAAGAAHGGPNAGFYGHLVSCPVTFHSPSDYVSLSQYHSDYSVLLNRAGRRFVDESRLDHASTQMTVREQGARALLVWDERIQQEHILKPFVRGAVAVDRMKLALANGARGLIMDRLEEVVGFADEIGFDGRSALATLLEYNRACRSAPESLTPPRTEDWIPLEHPPYYALQVQPAITFAYSGLAVDAVARALDTVGHPVPGLLVAGADAGNVYRDGYGGGLALASTFGFRAAETAAGSALARPDRS